MLDLHICDCTIFYWQIYNYKWNDDKKIVNYIGVCVRYCSDIEMCSSHFVRAFNTHHIHKRLKTQTRARGRVCMCILCDCTQRFYHVLINDRSKKKKKRKNEQTTTKATETMTKKRKLEHVRLHEKPLFYWYGTCERVVVGLWLK